MPSDSSQSVSDIATCGESDLKSALEAAFGPGAFELIAEPETLNHTDGGASEQVPSPGPVCGNSGRPLETAAKNEDAPRPVNPVPVYPFVLFGVAENYFALPVSNVVEVRRTHAVTRIPRVPDWIRGVVNLRGSIVSVLDLRRRLGMASDVYHDGCRMIVARSDRLQTTVGILVDRVVGMVSLSGSDVTEVPCMLDETMACYMSHLMMYDSRPVAVLDLEKTLAA